MAGTVWAIDGITAVATVSTHEGVRPTSGRGGLVVGEADALGFTYDRYAGHGVGVTLVQVKL